MAQTCPEQIRTPTVASNPTLVGVAEHDQSFPEADQA
jgi:hypothetical protein